MSGQNGSISTKLNIKLIANIGEFDNNSGFGVERYAYNLYLHLSHQHQINLGRSEINPLFNIKTASNLFLGALKFSYLKCNSDILHFLTHIPFTNNKKFRISSGKNVTIATAHEFGIIVDSVAREIAYKEFVPNLLSFKKYLNFKLWQKIILGALQADFLLPNSTQTMNEALKLGYPKNRIFLVNLGIEDAFLKPSIRKENKNFILGYLGGLRKRKNVSFAIDAMRYVNDTKIKFEIFGKGEEYLNLKKNANAVKNINFKGFAPNQKIISIYDSFDAFVFPSLYEGFGLPILEAQSRGLPVIIYKKGKIPKEVRKYCFEAESPEHMAQIIKNIKENGYNGKLQKKATEYARSFTWGKTAKETLEVYKKVL